MPLKGNSYFALGQQERKVSKGKNTSLKASELKMEMHLTILLKENEKIQE